MPRPLVAHHQHGPPREGELEDRLRVGRLLQADDRKPFVAQPLEHRRQRAMDFDLQGLGGVAGDLADHLGIAAADHPPHAAAAGRTDDPRQVHVAPHGRAGHDQLPRPIQRCRRLVTLLDEVGHGQVELRPLGRRSTWHFAKKQGQETVVRLGGPKNRPWPLVAKNATVPVQRALELARATVGYPLKRTSNRIRNRRKNGGR